MGTVPAAVAASSKRVAKDRHRRLLVRLAEGTTAADLTALCRSLDTSSGAVEELGGGALAWRVPAGVALDEFAKRLEDSGKVAYAEPNYTRQLSAYEPPPYQAPNDPDFNNATKYYYGPSSADPVNLFPYGKSWWLRDVHAPEAWGEGFNGPSTTGHYPLRASGETVKVAVLDTGYWSPSSTAPHPEMNANVRAGWDCYDGDGDVTPPDPWDLIYGLDQSVLLASHGTCVAGIIAAEVNNGEGVAGVGYDTQVVVYKVAGSRNRQLVFSDDAATRAINLAVADGCDVINMSFGGPVASSTLQHAIDDAWSAGCIVVAAAGNDGKSTIAYPARGNHVVSVSALTKNASGTKTQVASWSSYGPGLDISAPGAMIWGLSRPGSPHYGYAWWDGTSMASPVVAGGLALLWRAMPSLTGDQVVAYAKSTATDLGTTGYDTRTGSGELNLFAAYKKLQADYPLLAASTQISIPATASVRGVPVSWSAVTGYSVTYDVALDGVTIASRLPEPGFALPALSLGAHQLTITPHSPRNWDDASSVATRTFTVNADVPVGLSLKLDGVTLRWTSTESSATHSDRLWVDGDLKTVTGGSYNTAALGLGNHTATFAVIDADGVQSAPLSLTFRIRPKPSVTRLSGSDRYAANVALSRSVRSSATTAVLVSGQTWPDALSAGPLAAKLGAPVLLTSSASLTPATASELARLGTRHVVVVGGPNSVSNTVITSLQARDMTVTRLWGTNRYTTADAVARELARRSGGSVARAMVVSGETFTDALVASVVAAKMGWPVLLSAKTTVSSPTLATLSAIQATSTVVVGGTASVSDAAKAKLPGASRISARTSAGVAVELAEWATRTYPSDFPLEGFYLASNSAYADGLGVGAAAANTGSLLLLTPPALAPETRAYYTAHHDEAVTTRVVGGPATLPDSVMNSVRSIVGAP